MYNEIGQMWNMNLLWAFDQLAYCKVYILNAIIMILE